MTHKHQPCGLLYDTAEALARHSRYCPQTSHSPRSSHHERIRNAGVLHSELEFSIQSGVQRGSVKHTTRKGLSHSLGAALSRKAENRRAVMISNIRKLDRMSVWFHDTGYSQ